MSIFNKIKNWVKERMATLWHILQKEPATEASKEIASSFEERVQKVQERPSLFWGVCISWSAIMLGVAFLAIFFYWEVDTEPIEGLSFSIGTLIIVIQLLWLAASFKALNVNEVGSVVAYGLPLVRLRRGPKLIPFGLLQLSVFPASVNLDQFPADPELIQKTDDKVPLEILEIPQPDGSVIKKSKVRPIRITTSKPKESLGEDDILNSQLTVTFTFWVRWIIDDPFEFQINANGDVENTKRQMRDSGESFLTAKVTQLTPSELISEFFTLQKGLGEKLTEKLRGWGITIIDVGMTAPDGSHKLASELRNIATKKAQAVQELIDINLHRTRLHQEGKGRGKAREEEIAGEGRGYKRSGKFIGVSPQTVLEAEVAKNTVGEGDLILGTDGLTQAIGIGSHLLNREKSSNQKGEE